VATEDDSMSRCAGLAWATALVFLIPAPAAAQGSTTDLLGAARVKQRLTIVVNESEAGLEFDVVRDGAAQQNLDEGTLLAAKGPVRVLLKPFKPLKYAYSVKVEGFADETATDLAKFVQGILNLGTVLRPDITDLAEAARGTSPLRTRAGAATCPLQEDADAADVALKALEAAVNNPDARRLERMFKDHVEAGTQAAVAAAAKAIGDAADNIEDAAEQAGRQLDIIRALRAKLQAESSCVPVARFLFAADSGGATLRIDNLRAMAANLSGLADSLRSFTRWDGDAYQLTRDIVAQPDEGKKVTVALRPRAFTVSETAFVERTGGATVSRTFNLRSARTVVPELGIGLVVSRVKQPKYGTGKNEAGDTIVTREDDEETSYEGALLLNLVCRCRFGGGVFPMLQFGVSPDRDRPAILGGLGVRFGGVSGLKNVGFALGGVLAFPKDLTDLKVGDVVDGTTAIEADLDFKPTVKAYFTIQYSF
jgi:hypothetical protein